MQHVERNVSNKKVTGINKHILKKGIFTIDNTQIKLERLYPSLDD